MWMCALRLLFFLVCAHLTPVGGCAQSFMTYLLHFFFIPLSYFTKVRFPCYFFTITIDHRRWSLLAEVLRQQARLLFVALISFRWQLKKRESRMDGRRGKQYFSLCQALLHSTPFIATPTPLLGSCTSLFPSRLLLHCRHCSTFSHPPFLFFVSVATKLSANGPPPCVTCILLPFLWSVFFLPCLLFPLTRGLHLFPSFHPV